MTTCPHCNTPIDPATEACPHCGEKVIPASSLEKISTKTTGWQKFVIAVSIVVLVAIGFTFQHASEREDAAAQGIFDKPAAAILSSIATRSNLAATYGNPAMQFTADTKSARMAIDFPSGPMPVRQARAIARTVCESLARLYVDKGYMPRMLYVSIACNGPNGSRIHYGQAVYDGNRDAMSWEPAARQ